MRHQVDLPGASDSASEGVDLPKVSSDSEDSNSDSKEYAFAPEMTENKKKDYSCEGISWQEMEDAFEDAPFRAKLIVDHLKKNIDPTWRASFFIGPQGVGKSTVAIAIPHFANWYIRSISAA
ncbi:MAG TPA: hypothetical protein VI521_03240, partial [Candidatus Babeliales bacterium]|nr:hypothetical protein [Candidatus Babeliales bacterium]